MSTLKNEEVFVPVEDGYKVWTQSIGGGDLNDRPALLVLHGGPGMAHDYLENLSALASDAQKVVFYDQLGCGQSDAPDDSKRWQVSRFVKEVDFVRNALGLDDVVILGQSWGGMLTIEYLLTKPKGVKGAILSNSLSSAQLMDAEVQRLKSELPKTVLEIIERHEKSGTTQSDEYQKSIVEFYQRHILRINPFPIQVMEALASTNQVYETMWGSNEFTLIGNLKYWDRTSDLGKIDLPIKIISGEFDESTPKVNQVLKQGLKNSDWVMMPGCSHLPNYESPTDYMKIIQDFLDQLSNK